MLFQFGFYSSLLLISFSQGIIYSVLLLLKAVKTDNKSNYWLSLFIFLCSLYIAPWMLGFAGWYDNQPYRDILFYTPFQHLFLIGPVIYCYTQSLLNAHFRLDKKQLLHFIPGIAYLLYILIIWIYDTFVVGHYYFYQNGMDKDFDYWYQKAGLVSMVIYFALSIRYYNSYRKLIYQVVSYADKVLFQWIKTYLQAFLIMLLLPVIFDILVIFYPEIASYTGSWWFYLCFSIIMYYIAVTGYSNPVSAAISFELSVFDKRSILLLEEDQQHLVIEEAAIVIAPDTSATNHFPEVALWKAKTAALILSEQLYRNPELTLSDVAKKLDTNATVISKVINQGFQMNFNDFINNFRIEAVKRSFEQGEHKKSTLLGIAFDCGFNSKATFNRAFKKNTGLSPKAFIEKL